MLTNTIILKQMNNQIFYTCLVCDFYVIKILNKLVFGENNDKSKTLLIYQCKTLDYMLI